MTEIMHTNFLDAGFFTAGTELGVYPAFCKWEQAVVRIVFQKPAGIVLNNGAEEIRQSNIALAFWSFWLVYDFPAIGHCKVFCDMQHLISEVEVGQAERQQLPLTDASIKQDVKSAVWRWLVYSLNESFELVLGPEQHCIRF